MNHATLTLLVNSLGSAGFETRWSGPQPRLIRKSTLPDLYECVDLLIGEGRTAVLVSSCCSVVRQQSTQWVGLFEDGPSVRQLYAEGAGKVEFESEPEWHAWIHDFATLMPAFARQHAESVGDSLLERTKAARSTADAGIRTVASAAHDASFEDRIRIRDAQKRMDVFRVVGLDAAFEASIRALVLLKDPDLLAYLEKPPTPPTEVERLSAPLYAAMERSRTPRPLIHKLLILTDRLVRAA